jgi:dTDP-4-dehydrorhamnose reductase
MLKKATAGEAIRVVADQVLTPTYTMDLAEVTRRVIMTGAFGLTTSARKGNALGMNLLEVSLSAQGLPHN